MSQMLVSMYAETRDRMQPIVMRMLDSFEDVPGFVSLKKILLRPLLHCSRDAADTMDRLDRVSYLCRECYEIRVFNALLGHMTREEKGEHVVSLGHMFKGLMARHGRRFCSCFCSVLGDVIKFARLYVELNVETEQGTSGELVQFVGCFIQTTPIDLDFVLRGINPNAVEYLLACFSDERYHAYGIRESDYLMLKLVKDEHMLSVVLMRHGFKYSFDQNYYKFRGRKLKVLFHEEPPVIIQSAFTDSGNLRMQMAMEILMCLHFEGGMNHREFLCTLWSSVPDPFITPDELYHLMEPFFVQGSPVLVEACAGYYDLIPGLTREKQPRPLKHLARVRIRESMVRAHSLGERVVRSLGIPKKLEDYLWKLEEF